MKYAEDPHECNSPELDTLTEAYDGGGAPDRIAIARIVSTRASNSALGSADGQIDENSTTPTSSASPSCASLAAASNSLATAQLIANVGSPPSEDSASVAPPCPSSVAISMPEPVHCGEYPAAPAEFKRTATEDFC